MHLLFKNVCIIETYLFTEHKELNALNIPTHDRKHQLRAKELVGQAAGLVKELIQGLSNFHTYCEQRTRIYPNDADREPMTDVNKKVSVTILYYVLQLSLFIYYC